MDQLKSMASMFPHLYGAINTPTSLSSLPSLPMLYPSMCNPLLSRIQGKDLQHLFHITNYQYFRFRFYRFLLYSLSDNNLLTIGASAETGGDVSPNATPSSNSNSKIKVTLDDKELWQRFHMFGTEMIVTRSGRCVLNTDII